MTSIHTGRCARIFRRLLTRPIPGHPTALCCLPGVAAALAFEIIRTELLEIQLAPTLRQVGRVPGILVPSQEEGLTIKCLQQHSQPLTLLTHIHHPLIIAPDVRWNQGPARTEIFYLRFTRGPGRSCHLQRRSEETVKVASWRRQPISR